jgi:hypothetical protein
MDKKDLSKGAYFYVNNSKLILFIYLKNIHISNDKEYQVYFICENKEQYYYLSFKEIKEAIKYYNMINVFESLSKYNIHKLYLKNKYSCFDYYLDVIDKKFNQKKLPSFYQKCLPCFN